MKETENKYTPATENQILAVIKDPGQPPRVEPLLENTLEALQETVGGRIKKVTICTDLVLICNADAVASGLPFNAKILGRDFCGTVICVGAKEDEFVSLKAREVPMLLACMIGKEKT